MKDQTKELQDHQNILDQIDILSFCSSQKAIWEIMNEIEEYTQNTNLFNRIGVHEFIVYLNNRYPNNLKCQEFTEYRVMLMKDFPNQEQ